MTAAPAELCDRLGISLLWVDAQGSFLSGNAQAQALGAALGLAGAETILDHLGVRSPTTAAVLRPWAPPHGGTGTLTLTDAAGRARRLRLASGRGDSGGFTVVLAEIAEAGAPAAPGAPAAIKPTECNSTSNSSSKKS